MDEFKVLTQIVNPFLNRLYAKYYDSPSTLKGAYERVETGGFYRFVRPLHHGLPKIENQVIEDLYSARDLLIKNEITWSAFITRIVKHCAFLFKSRHPMAMELASLLKELRSFFELSEELSSAIEVLVRGYCTVLVKVYSKGKPVKNVDVTVDYEVPIDILSELCDTTTLTTDLNGEVRFEAPYGSHIIVSALGKEETHVIEDPLNTLEIHSDSTFKHLKLRLSQKV